MLNIQANLRPSRLFLTLILLVFLSNIVIIVYLPFSLLIKFLLFIFNLLYSYYVYRHVSSIKKLILDANSLKLGNDAELMTVQLAGESTITHWICILRFKIRGKRFKRSCVIFKDALQPDTYRQLIVALRCMKWHGISL